MGQPNVFRLTCTRFIGCGTTGHIWHNGYGKTLVLVIIVPFLTLEIYCRKNKDNNWF